MAPIDGLCDGYHIAGTNYCMGRFAVYTFDIEIDDAELFHVGRWLWSMGNKGEGAWLV
jgi:hypothetical protein